MSLLWTQVLKKRGSLTLVDFFLNVSLQYMLDPSAQWPELSTDGHHSRMFKYLGGGSPDA